MPRLFIGPIDAIFSTDEVERRGWIQRNECGQIDPLSPLKNRVETSLNRLFNRKIVIFAVAFYSKAFDFQLNFFRA
jgi:hypothetical protein